MVNHRRPEIDQSWPRTLGSSLRQTPPHGAKSCGPARRNGCTGEAHVRLSTAQCHGGLLSLNELGSQKVVWAAEYVTAAATEGQQLELVHDRYGGNHRNPVHQQCVIGRQREFNPSIEACRGPGPDFRVRQLTGAAGSR